eukprot:CAMPEP_0179424304 /NCGR_PEP_ID=MMETSP0799-20121207/11507_1 /TAXON_ID=46947 /ORGANISM="Geminigera cryophila, Strain CCMP2564" /LENGTH=201 /DNA_ID=CAMNT_0021198727 /DNA_START=191 /DNA_END=796 /DNA_ORIENTATION=+
MPTNSTTLELPPQPRRNSACIYIFHKICIYIFHSDGYVQISPGMYLHTSPCQATQLRGKCRHNDSEKNHKEKGTHEAHSAAVGQAAFGKEIHSPLLDHPRAKHRRQDNTRDLHHDGHQQCARQRESDSPNLTHETLAAALRITRTDVFLAADLRLPFGVSDIRRLPQLVYSVCQIRGKRGAQRRAVRETFVDEGFELLVRD